MLYNHFTEELLGLQAVKITNVKKEENNSFLPRYHRMPSFTSAAREVNLSVSTIIRIFDLVSYPKTELPRVLSIRVLVMLETSVNLSGSHWYKEKFLEILECSDRETAKEKMQECADSMQNRRSGLLNSFSSPHTNGFTEGCNNKIKVLKRNAYGYKNFRSFRNRILHIFSHKRLNKEQAAA